MGVTASSPSEGLGGNSFMSTEAWSFPLAEAALLQNMRNLAKLNYKLIADQVVGKVFSSLCSSHLKGSKSVTRALTFRRVSLFSFCSQSRLFIWVRGVSPQITPCVEAALFLESAPSIGLSGGHHPSAPTRSEICSDVLQRQQVTPPCLRCRSLCPNKPKPTRGTGEGRGEQPLRTILKWSRKES